MVGNQSIVKMRDLPYRPSDFILPCGKLHRDRTLQQPVIPRKMRQAFGRDPRSGAARGPI